jgi:hypothetical protein
MKRLLRLLPWIAMAIMAIIFLPRPAATQDRDRREGREGHPHIQAALQELREAKHELEVADRDFCGRRRDAVRQCDQAMQSLQRALDCDRR